MLAKAIYPLLNNDATLTALVGSKIYPVKAPQNTSVPFVVFTVNATLPVNTKEGVATKEQKQLQVDTYASTLANAGDIAEAIRNILDNHSGTTNNVNIRQMWFDDEDYGDFIEDLGFFSISQAYEVIIER